MTANAEKPNEALDTPADVLPLVPAELDIDPLLLALLQCAAFLDLSEDGAGDSGAATDVLELVGLYVQRLSAERHAELAGQLAKLREHGERNAWPEELVVFVDEFLYSCGVGEDVEA